MIDTGAQVSVIDKYSLRQLFSGAPEENYLYKSSAVVAALGGGEPLIIGRAFINIWLSEETSATIEVLVAEELSIYLDSEPGLEAHFPGLKLSDDYSKIRRIDLVLGQDVIWRVILGRMYRSSTSDLIAMETVWGWVPQGAHAYPEEKVLKILSTVERLQEADREKEKDYSELIKCLKGILSLESMGIEPTCETEMKVQDKYALDFFMEHLTYDPEAMCYTSRLIFDPNHPELLNNRKGAEFRLWSVMKKLDRNPHLKQPYFDAMNDYFEKGDAVWVDEEFEPSNCYYLPHSGVIKDSATTAMRIVFDGSFPGQNRVSLNKCLLPGPQYEPDFLRLVYKFRADEIALCGDVSRMYLAVRLHKDDRKFLRFLWFKDGVLKVANMTKITFGIADSSFQATETLKVHAKKHLEDPNFGEDYKDSIDILINDRWVDDVVTSLPNHQKAELTLKQVTEIMATASFKFRKWMSNDRALMNSLKTEDRADLKDPMDFANPTEEGRWMKTLGLKWNPISDQIAPVTELELSEKEENSPTRRTVASGMAQLFDPLGILSPFTVVAKIIHQDVWKEVTMPKHPTKKERKAVWDEKLNEDLKNRWNAWKKQVDLLKNVSLPRQVSFGKAIKAELHVFCDASPKAMGAVIYKLSTMQDGSKQCTFVVAKCKTSPKDKCESIPRLELVAALMGSRLLDHYRGSVQDFLLATIWTDSAIAYHWLQKNHTSWKTFVANRVKEIHRLTEKDAWRHIPGVKNVSDLATRGLTAQEFLDSKDWFNGPDWLKKGRDFWPLHCLKQEDIIEAEKEELKPKKLIAVAKKKVTFKALYDKQKMLDKLQESTSHYGNLLRRTAYLLRVAYRRPNVSLEVMPHEIEAAQEFWVKKMQNDCFAEELKVLRKKEELSESSPLAKLKPYIDVHGVLRVGGQARKIS